MSQIVHCISNGVLVTEAKQRHELVLRKLLHAHRQVIMEHKVKEGLLLTGVLGMDVKACLLGACRPPSRRPG